MGAIVVAATLQLGVLARQGWEAWREGPGAAMEERSEAADRAARAVPWVPLWAAGQVYPAVGGGETALIEPSGWLIAEVGPGPFARGGAWRAEADAREALAVDHGTAWVATAVDGWLAVWVAQGEAVHLEEHVAHLDADLEGLRTAAGEQHVAALDLADLEAERARYRAEADDAALRAVQARGALERWLAGATLPPVPVPDLDAELPPLLAAMDPWTHAATGSMPAVRAAEARRDAAEAAARAACSTWSAQIGGGVAGRTDGPTGAPTGYLTLQVPLGLPERDGCVAARGERMAASLDHARALELAEALVTSRSSELEALAERARTLEASSVDPLRARQALLEEAWEARHVPLSRVLRGRWELHEAEHAVLLAQAAWLRAWAHGEVVRLAGEGA